MDSNVTSCYHKYKDTIFKLAFTYQNNIFLKQKEQPLSIFPTRLFLLKRISIFKSGQVKIFHIPEPKYC